MKFFREVIASLIKQADESTSTHSSFRIADSTAVGDNPVRELSLDVVAISPESSIVTLAWKDSAEKILEKKTSPEEASHLSQLLATDLAQLVKLTDENKYDEAKEVLKSMLKEYSQDSSTPTETNLPKLNTTQAEKDIDEGLWKIAGEVKMQNVFPSGTVQNIVFQNQEDLAAYQGKGKTTGKEVPLWEQEGKGKTPEGKQDLVAPSMSYQDLEEEKEKTEQDMGKRIEREVKEQIESSLAQKQATLFTDKDKQLVDALRGVGRSWEEVRDFMTKSLKYEKEDVAAYLDQFRGDEKGEEINVEKEKSVEDVMRPPKDLVTDETHNRLLDDLKKDKEPIEEVKEKEIEKVDEAPIVEESSKKSICPECNGEGDVPAVRGGHVVAISCPSCSGDKHIEHSPKELESNISEISRADNTDIRKIALKLWKSAPNYMGEDLSEYYVGPGKGYDADALEKSNFKVALEMLGGEGNGVLVGSFGGFGGGFEQIFVHKDAAEKVAILQNIEEQMAGYPVLDESDYSEQEMEDQRESYKSWARGDALNILNEELHRQNPSLEASLSDIELSPEVENKLASVVFNDLSYGDGTALTDKHLIQEADKEGLLNDLRNALGGKEVIPENPNQMRLFESSLRAKVASYMDISETDSIIKTAADDLNPLQEPIQEEPTMETPEQDVIPFGQAQHRAPKPESWVVVQSDLKGELPAFRGKFVSEETESDGTKWGIVDKDGELLKVEMHRITPETEGAQTTDPVATPEIEKPIEQEVPTVPSTEKLTSLTSELNKKADRLHCPKCGIPTIEDTGIEDLSEEEKMCEKCYKEQDKESSQDDLLTIKVEAEQLLKDIEGMGKKSYLFIKKGLEKHADDSAFEGNGWCRVWVQEVELESDAKYPEILKLADESARIAALKELARDKAYEALRLADNAGAKVGVQAWFESLQPSDHDRIDWVALASPQVEAESSLKQADNVMDTKCEECGKPLGPEAFLSKWPVCGDCTRKRHKKVTGSIGKEAIKVEFIEEEGTQGSLESLRKFLNSKFKNQEQMEMQFESLAAEWAMANGYTMSWAESESSDGGALRFTKNSTHVSPDWKPKQASLQLKASDFEKGISQNKTADEPAVEPKVKYKELQKAPAYTDREQAVPASPELDQVLARMDALEQNLATLDNAKKQIQAKMKEEIAKLEQSAERVQMEKELQESINKSAVLIDALQNKVVSWRDKVYTLQTQEVSYVPNVTPSEMLQKIYQKFAGAEAFVSSVLNGMKSQAVNVLEKTLVKFPGKKSSLNKEASVIDEWNDELLQALKELSSPL